MKIHKKSAGRIFFTMDSGAHGSVSTSDVSKLLRACRMPDASIDARTGECLVDLYNDKDPRFPGTPRQD